MTEFKHDGEDGGSEYTLTQAARRLRLKIEPELGPGGVVTEITIEEK